MVTVRVIVMVRVSVSKVLAVADSGGGARAPPF